MVAFRESLLSASAVKLYGRIVLGLTIDVDHARNELGANRFLREQLEATKDSEGKSAVPQLARIYGYSFNGRYVALARPALFLVHGDGEFATPRSPVVVQATQSADGTLGIDPPPVEKGESPPFRDPGITARLSIGPTTTDSSGQAVKCCEFSADIKVWEYDRGDFSLRLDIESGPLERILLDAEEGSDAPPYYRGAKTRMRSPGE